MISNEGSANNKGLLKKIKTIFSLEKKRNKVMF